MVWAIPDPEKYIEKAQIPDGNERWTRSWRVTVVRTIPHVCKLGKQSGRSICAPDEKNHMDAKTQEQVAASSFRQLHMDRNFP